MRARPELKAGLLAAFAAAALALPAIAFSDREKTEASAQPGASAYAPETAAGGSVGLRAFGGALQVSAAALKAGLDALAARDLATARRVIDNLPADALDRRILTWAIALSGDPSVPSREIAAAAATLPDWPGMAALRRHLERAMAREKPKPEVVVEALGGAAPETVEGALLMARARMALGQPDAARAALAPFWRMERLEAKDEAAIIREFGELIPASDHRFRMERMLYLDRITSAQRVAPLAGAAALADAWAAVIRREKNADKLLEAVPEAQRSSGFYYARARHLRWQGRFSAAAQALLAAPEDWAAGVDPDAWWAERRVLSRELLDAGEPTLAYEVAAAQAGGSPATLADAAFHAGWYALRFLDDPAAAAKHFQRIAEVSSGPVSLARAHYWLGRAAEAGGPGDAKTHYERAAANGTAFYGQLAAQKLGRNTIVIDSPQPLAAERKRFAGREAVAAIRRLEEAGHGARADMLYRELAGQLSEPGELSLLAAMAERRGDHFLALRVAKTAALRGLDIGALAHPLGAIPDTATIGDAGKALAYAVARQESEFNVAAVSGAGARGLLQLLPGTARDMARKAGLDYSLARLTTDAGYNATLGAAFLSDQLDRFGGSYVLTIAGYNAGPRRAQDWAKRYGDPRGMELDAVVDWIERIPFTETRNYVQRVMENHQVYRMRLTGRFDLAGDLVEGRQSD